MRRKWKFIVPALALLGTCLLFRLFGELKVGDIVVFRHGGKLLVKRIAATEGNVVEYKGQGMTVPKDCFYVLGDNAGNSFDSRFWTKPFISYSAIISRSFP